MTDKCKHVYEYHVGFNAWVCYGCQKPNGTFAKVLGQKEVATILNSHASLTEKVERLEKAFDALHKHRYDSECEECSRIVALLESE